MVITIDVLQELMETNKMGLLIQTKTEAFILVPFGGYEKRHNKNLHFKTYHYT